MNQILLCRLQQKTDRKIDQTAKFYYTILYYVKKISGVEVELGTYKKYLFSKSKSTSLYHVLELDRAMKSLYYPCISTDKCLWKRRFNFILHIVWFCLHLEIFWLN